MKQMKAAFIRRYGRTNVLEVGDIDIPAPAPSQILIKVKAASINPRDWLLMRGLYPFKKLAEPFPIVLGSDMSGTVVAVGTKVKSIKAGDDVFGMQPIKGKFGALAEFAAIEESAVALKPAELSHAEAAAMPCAGMTSYQTIRDLAHVKRGEAVLVNGASGGVGSYAVQMAKLAGAYVIAVTGPENQQLCRELGADEVINYREDNFEDADNAYDIVYDVIGRSSPSRCRQALRKGGRYVSTIPSLPMLVKSWFSKLTAHIGLNKGQTAHLILVKPHGPDLAEMAQLTIKGKMKSLLDSHFSLEDAAAAFEKSQSWRAKGKIIIDIAP